MLHERVANEPSGPRVVSLARPVYVLRADWSVAVPCNVACSPDTLGRRWARDALELLQTSLLRASDCHRLNILLTTISGLYIYLIQCGPLDFLYRSEIGLQFGIR